MWQEYVGKKILCAPFDEDDDSGIRFVLEFIVLKVLDVELNNLAYVMRADFQCEWIYPAKYTVIEEQSITDPNDTWNQYVGKRIICRKIYHDDELGDPKEYLVVRTKGDYAMVVDFGNQNMSGNLCSVWKNTAQENVMGVL